MYQFHASSHATAPRSWMGTLPMRTILRLLGPTTVGSAFRFSKGGFRLSFPGSLSTQSFGYASLVE